jgi:hypothetical protein
MRRLRQEVLRDPCGPAPASGQFAWWDAIGPLAMPSVARTWENARDAALDGERTAVVLESRWGAAGPRRVPSRVCPEAAWVQETRPEGGRIVRLEGPRAVAARWTFTFP